MSILITDELLNELKGGSERAFASLFAVYFPRICQFAVTYVRDQAVAKNIVQDAFVKLWENKHTINGSSSVIPYLLTITKYDCLNYLKHQQVEEKFKKRIEHNHKQLELNYYALQRLEIDFLNYEEMMQIVEKTIESLPPQCQQVFRLSRFGNLSNIEIAEKLSIGVKAVEANITRALKVFREELKDYIVILLLLNIPLN